MLLSWRTRPAGCASGTWRVQTTHRSGGTPPCRRGRQRFDVDSAAPEVTDGQACFARFARAQFAGRIDRRALRLEHATHQAGDPLSRRLDWSLADTAREGLAMSEVTRILCAIEEGDSRAAEQLLPLV